MNDTPTSCSPEAEPFRVRIQEIALNTTSKEAPARAPVVEATKANGESVSANEIFKQCVLAIAELMRSGTVGLSTESLTARAKRSMTLTGHPA